MKIGILTYHQSVNNGAVMQAYSLSRRVKEEFPDACVEIVDYRMPRIEQSYSYTIGSYFKGASLRAFLGKCKKLLKDIGYLERMQERTRIFSESLKRLPLSPEKIVDDSTEKVFKYIEKNYDVLVVGSDAIWNYVMRGFPNAYLPEETLSVKKMSYAASCYGMDFLKRPESEKNEIRKSLNDFSFIGVRDGATEKFVEWSGSKKTAYHTCDPTVFLDVNNLPVDEEKIRQKLIDRGFDFDKPAIGMMGTPQMFNLIKRLYANRYQIVVLYDYIKGADVNLYDLEPYEWAYVFRFFKMTFTTYFHGTLLSLRNGVPVICIALNTEFSKIHTPKTLDVLTRLGFEDWYFKTDYESQNIDAIKEKADSFLNGDYKQKIIEAMDEEAKSFGVFKGALTEVIKTMEK